METEQLIKEIRGKIFKILESKKTYKNLWDTAKAMFRAMIAFI
jgi:hypothetical protein